MGLQKRSRVSAEFSMSSLTDIIFLLLIFFMLTSSLVIPNALNLKLPGKSKSSIVVDSKPWMVTVKRNGTYYLHGKRISLANLDRAMVKLKKQMKGRTVNITIAPHSKTDYQNVVAVMDIAYRLGINAILAEPK